MWAWAQAKHWLPLPLPLPVEAAGKSREGGRETPLQFEKIVVFDYPIIPSYKVETTMDFP